MAPVFIKRYGGDDGAGKYTELYGFKMVQSDNAVTIEYLEDNKNFTPCSSNAKNNYAAISGSNYAAFNYGSWSNAFFMEGIRPCMLKYDGTVDYYLDPNDFSKKEDGSASDISNQSYAGNVMIEFPKIYWKIENGPDGAIYVYVCDGKKDKDFVCWSHIDENGDEIDYCYMSAYLGRSIQNSSTGLNELRSVSGVAPTTTSSVTLLEYAKNNNRDGENIWCSDVYCDRVLLTILCLLISKSVDSQAVFGYGGCCRSSSVSSDTIKNGSYTDALGMFAPNTFYSSNNIVSNKVFGMQDLWARGWRYCAGINLNTSSQLFVKWTYGTKDGSSSNGYNVYSNNGKHIGNSSFGTLYLNGSERRILTMKADNSFGILPETIYTNSLGPSGADVSDIDFSGDIFKEVNSSYAELRYVAFGGGYYSKKSTNTPEVDKPYILQKGLFAVTRARIRGTIGTLFTGISCKPKKQ